MINPRISADWSTTKPIAAFSCTPHVQEVHIKAEVVHLTPGLLGLGVLVSKVMVTVIQTPLPIPKHDNTALQL